MQTIVCLTVLSNLRQGYSSPPQKMGRLPNRVTMVTEASAQPMIRKVARAFRRPPWDWGVSLLVVMGMSWLLSTNANRHPEFPAPMWICHQPETSCHQPPKKKGLGIHQVRGDINQQSCEYSAYPV